MATHSTILAWKILWMEEPDRLQSIALQSRTGLSMHTHAVQVQGEEPKYSQFKAYQTDAHSWPAYNSLGSAIPSQH